MHVVSDGVMISSAPSRVNLTQDGDLQEYLRVHRVWKSISKESTPLEGGQSSFSSHASPLASQSGHQISDRDAMRMRLGMK